MRWLEVTIKTRSGGIDLLAERLTVLGYDSFILDDEADFRTFLEENRRYWDYVDEELERQMTGLSQIRLYLEENEDAASAVEELRREMALLKQQRPDADLGTLEVLVSPIRNEDWENNWKQYYKPLPIGEKILVVPQWIRVDDPQGRIPVILDPGMIFGTGAHASTQMCLRALEQTIHGGERVLDLGSGSAILSIAALRLGAESAVAVDIDPMAEDIARENAARNGIGSDRFTALTGDVLTDRAMMERLAGGYDVVLANIVADVIVPLSRVVPELLTENGRFLCSGILDTRLSEVLAAMEQSDLWPLEVNRQEDWRQITACRR